MLWRALKALHDHLRPREGWLVLIATLTGLLLLTAAVADIGWVPGLTQLHGVAILGVLWGALMAKSPFSGRATAFFSVIFGTELVLMLVGRVAPPLQTTLAEIPYAVRWAIALGQGVVGRIPFEPVAQIWWQRALDFWQRLSIWALEVAQGGARQDNLIFLVFSGLLIWAMAAWAGWWVFRRRQGLVALLPAGVGLANNIFFAGEGEAWAVYFVAAQLALLIGLRRYTLQAEWDRRGLDYSDEIALQMYVSGALLSIVILVLMPVVPSISVQRIADAFWDLLSSPWQEVEESAERMFPELERPAVSPLRVGIGGSPEEMPRVHLLSGSPELDRRLAFRVQLNQAPPQFGGEKVYYRAITYAEYSGHGWSNLRFGDQLIATDEPPGEPWDPGLEALPGRRRLLQTFDLAMAPGGLLYAAGEPLAPDVPYRVRAWEPGDVISLAPLERVSHYSVISAVPAVSEEQLRAAGRDYPEGIRSRYLQLPDISPRVIEEARRVTEGIDNLYDQAEAIEAYLRTFEYSLDVPAVPPDREAVEYFLFDLRRGYCDYYATAMVVMARSLGIPARLAVGYASGYYDEYRDEFSVTEAEAHSWPELYFPPYGWIPFEPTAARSPFERIGLPTELTRGAGPVEAAPEASRLPSWGLPLGVWRRGVVAAGALLLSTIVIGVLWVQWRVRKIGVVAMAYEQTVRWGEWVGEAHSLAETPVEHALMLGDHLNRVAGAARRGRSWLLRWAGRLAADIRLIAEAYTRQTYARRPLAEIERRQVMAAWRRLWGKLWAFWIARWL